MWNTTGHGGYIPTSLSVCPWALFIIIEKEILAEDYVLPQPEATGSWYISYISHAVP
jgi:hypothetical protein